MNQAYCVAQWSLGNESKKTPGNNAAKGNPSTLPSVKVNVCSCSGEARGLMQRTEKELNRRTREEAQRRAGSVPWTAPCDWFM